MTPKTRKPKPSYRFSRLLTSTKSRTTRTQRRLIVLKEPGLASIQVWLFRVSGFRQFFGTAEWKRIVKHNMGRISLVVDDEPAVRKYISAILQREHFQTVEAGDGEHGLRIVQELGEEVALIVSDIHMPNGDGVAFAQAVKAAFPAVPIILVSGQAEPHPEFGFIRKPFLPSVLLKTVREVVADSLRTVPADC